MSLIGDRPKYYQHFLDLVADGSAELDPQTLANFKDPQFRRHLQEQTLHPDLIREVAPYVRPMLAKPQELLVDNPDYYVAIDQMTGTYYICYRELLMLDIDLYKPGKVQTLEGLLALLPECYCQLTATAPACRRPECALRYRIFGTRGGYHLFLISHPMDPRSTAALQLMMRAGVDFFYIIFSYLRGWSVRLNTKPGEAALGAGLYPALGDWSAGRLTPAAPSQTKLEALVELHLQLCQVFRYAKPCISFAHPKPRPLQLK